MAKSKEETRRISGLPKDTDRVSFRMLTSEDDPHYVLHTMTHSMREVGKKKRVKGGGLNQITQSKNEVGQ